MLEYITDGQGNLQAVCDYWIVNEKGIIDDKGKGVWINEIYVNPNLRKTGMIKEFIKRIYPKVPNMKYGYFKREKYQGRVRLYSLNQWIGRIKEAQNV